MSFNDWIAELTQALESAGPDVTPVQLDPDAMYQAFSNGVSPQIFASSRPLPMKGATRVGSDVFFTEPTAGEMPKNHTQQSAHTYIPGARSESDSASKRIAPEAILMGGAALVIVVCGLFVAKSLNTDSTARDSVAVQAVSPGPVNPEPVMNGSATAVTTPKPTGPSVDVSVLNCGLYWDMGSPTGRIHVLIGMNDPGRYAVLAWAGSRKNHLRKLVPTENTNSGGPYPMFGQYYEVPSRSALVGTKFVKVQILQGGKPVLMNLPSGKSVKEWILETSGQDDPSGWLGESSDATSIERE